MKFGLTDEEYNFIKQTVVRPLSTRGATVWCFGSRARGDFNRFSDLDLMIENANHLEQIIGAIQETLSNSNFPFKVDLVKIDDYAQSYLETYQKDKKVF